jgi:aminopeptidase N
LGCTVEDLTVVVLAHELAHAYTQLGADIEGRRWPSKAFSSAEIDLKEGLAQYYTVRSLKRLTVRFPEAMHTFETLLEKQPPAYHRHEPWAAESFSPEAVRRAMIEVRRWNEGTLEQFETRLKKASEDFKPLPGGLFH